MINEHPIQNECNTGSFFVLWGKHLETVAILTQQEYKCILEKGLKNMAKCWRLLIIEIDQYPTLRPPKGSRHASETVVMLV